jgi:hypothetical protein
MAGRYKARLAAIIDPLLFDGSEYAVSRLYPGAFRHALLQGLEPFLAGFSDSPSFDATVYPLAAPGVQNIQGEQGFGPYRDLRELGWIDVSQFRDSGDAFEDRLDGVMGTTSSMTAWAIEKTALALSFAGFLSALAKRSSISIRRLRPGIEAEKEVEVDVDIGIGVTDGPPVILHWWDSWQIFSKLR